MVSTETMLIDQRFRFADHKYMRFFRRMFIRLILKRKPAFLVQGIGLSHDSQFNQHKLCQIIFGVDLLTRKFPLKVLILLRYF